MQRHLFRGHAAAYHVTTGGWRFQVNTFFAYFFLSPSNSNIEQRRCTDSFARFQQESWEQSLTDCYLDGQHDSRFATGCVSPELIEQWTRNTLNCSNYSSIFSLFSWVLWVFLPFSQFVHILLDLESW
jgi:hypothetical protein